MTTINDFYVHQSTGYDFILDTAEHLRIAAHGSAEERAAAAERYRGACRLNYMSVSEAVAWWRFTALTEEEFQAGLAELAEPEQEPEPEPEQEPEPEVNDDVEALVLERYGDLECPACHLQYAIFCVSPEPKEPCVLCNPQYIMDFKQWLADED